MNRFVTYKYFPSSVICQNTSTCGNLRYFRYDLKPILPCICSQLLTRESICRYSYVIRRWIFFISPPSNEIITVIELTHQLLLKNLACCSLVKKFTTFRNLLQCFQEPSTCIIIKFQMELRFNILLLNKYFIFQLIHSII